MEREEKLNRSIWKLKLKFANHHPRGHHHWTVNAHKTITSHKFDMCGINRTVNSTCIRNRIHIRRIYLLILHMVCCGSHFTTWDHVIECECLCARSVVCQLRISSEFFLLFDFRPHENAWHIYYFFNHMHSTHTTTKETIFRNIYTTKSQYMYIWIFSAGLHSLFFSLLLSMWWHCLIIVNNICQGYQHNWACVIYNNKINNQ